MPDPEIIELCGRQDWRLITSDKNMPTTWIREIKTAQIGIFLLSNQNDGSDVWGRRIIACDDQITHEAINRERPFVARISDGGKLYMLSTLDQEAPTEKPRWRSVYFGSHE